MQLRRLSWLASARAPGFAGIEGLCAPADFRTLTRDAVAKCEALVGEVVRAPPATAAAVRLLDEMSDTICQVLDAAEFCRNVHADEEWRQHAQQACIELGSYIQELNTHYGLYSSLAKSLDEHDRAAAAAAAAAAGRAAAAASAAGGEAGWGQPGGVLAGSSGNPSSSLAGSSPSLHGRPPVPGWSEEAVLVGRMLRRDFERYGVHLPGERRDHMAGLMQRVQALGMAVTQNVSDPRQLGTLELKGRLAAAAQQLPFNVLRRFRALPPGPGGGLEGLAAVADTPTMHAVLRSARDEGLRRTAFEACQRQPVANLAALDALVEARHEVASMTGYPSFAQYQLDGFSLASRPAAVVAFLQRFAVDIAPKCADELAVLQDLKRRHLGSSYSSSSLASAAGAASATAAAAVPGQAEHVEVWPWDRQFLAGAARSREDAEQLAALPEYFELERVVDGLSELLRRSMGVRLEERPLEPGESWAPGVRRLDATHDTDGFLGTVYLDLYRRPHKFPSAAHFTLRCGRRLPNGSYQTPVVALVANLQQHCSLAVREVETLFHEFGHALNSLLSRTEYQHLSGTRGPVDLVEVPSHTLELFAHDPRVLSLFARHRTTGDSLPAGLVSSLEASRRRFVALDQQQQLQYCLIDQLLHGPDPPTGTRAQEAIAEITRRHSSLAHPQGCHPHIRFTHLVGYGAIYYSYLFAQCLAARIWQDHLAEDPMSPEAGERLRHLLMEPGGAKEAHRMVQDLLAPPGGSGDGSRTVGSSGSSDGSSSGGGGGSRASGLCEAGGGFYPDPSAMLEQQGLLVV